MVATVNPNQFRVFDANGDPVESARLYADESGTTTPADIFSDTDLTTQHPVPLVADAGGVFPAIYNDGSALKIRVYANDNGADGALLYEIDPVSISSNSTANASNISFASSTQVPETNVQEAIDYVAALASQDPDTWDFSGDDLTFDNSQISGLAVEEATATVRGTVEIADITEARAGTINTKVLTPARGVNFLQGQPLGPSQFNQIYSSAVDGSQATVSSSTWEDYQTYGFWFRGVSHDDASDQTLQLTITREDATSVAAVDIAAAIPSSGKWNGWIAFHLARNGNFDFAWADIHTYTDDVTYNADAITSISDIQHDQVVWSFDTATKIDGVTLSASAGNINQGIIYEFEWFVGRGGSFS